MIHRFSRFAIFLLVLPLLWGAPNRAAAQGQGLKLRFSTTRVASLADSKETPLLRPNQTQEFFLFVNNSTAKDETVTVEVLAGDKALDGGTVAVTAKANDLTPVVLGKPPQPADKAAPPAAPEKPAPLPELKGALKIVLYGKDAANKRVDYDAVTPILAKPADYVEVFGSIYDLKEKPGIKNQLVFKVRAKPNFQGGPCRVDIDLKPARIPGFIDVPRKEGTRGGKLEHPGDELTLTANNLQFKDTTDKPDEKKDGTVYLTIDGYERAYIFKSTFPRSGVTESELDRIRIPVARLKAAPSANPEKPYPLAIELDNAAPESVLEISLDRDGDGKFSKKGGEITTLGSGNRNEKLFFNPAFPDGALEIKSQVADWSTALDVAGIFGPRTLRVRLLKDAAEIAKDEDDPKKSLISILNGATEKTDFAIVETVIFDGTPPEGIAFVDFPPQIVRGSALPVKVTAADPESGIKEVLFYVGKPGPDGKPPANAVQAAGALADPKTGIWTAMLDAPTEQKGKTEVTAQVTNGAGLVATATVKIELVDAGPAGAGGGKGSIEGKVLIADRPQPKVPVALRDAQGGVRDTTVTDEKGAYIFKDVAPASYRVTAAKTGDNTKGEAIVQVKEGEKKTGVDVKLVR